MSVLVLAGGAPRDGGADPGARPRVDYVEVARALGAEVSHRPEVGPRTQRLLRQVPGDWPHGLAARRRAADGVLSFSEDEALPLAVLPRRPRPLVAIAHNLTRHRLVALQRGTRWLRRIDRLVVLSREQERYALGAGVPAEQLRFVHDKVDHRFFTPAERQGEGGYVLAVGSESRDYATFVEAMRRLDVPAVVVASSQWFGAMDLGPVPDSVSVRSGLSFPELRALYDGAAAVAVPVLPGTRYAAGVNAVLEGMAMARPLVVSATPGLDGHLDDGETMLTVPPGDPAALAAGLERALSDGAASAERASRARAVVEGGRNLDGFVEALTRIVSDARAAAG